MAGSGRGLQLRDQKGLTEDLGPVDNYLSQTIMAAMQIIDKKAWAVLS